MDALPVLSLLLRAGTPLRIRVRFHMTRPLALFDSRDFVGPRPTHLSRVQVEESRVEARNLFERTETRPGEVCERHGKRIVKDKGDCITLSRLTL